MIATPEFHSTPRKGFSHLDTKLLELITEPEPQPKPPKKKKWEEEHTKMLRKTGTSKRGT